MFEEIRDDFGILREFWIDLIRKFEKKFEQDFRRFGKILDVSERFWMIRGIWKD